MTTQGQSPLACDLTAIEATEREAHKILVEHLLGEGAQEVQELADGYAFRFVADQYPAVTSFVANERICCPFFAFTIEVQPDQGPLWLSIRGREGVKAFFSDEVAARIGKGGCSTALV